MTTGADCQTAEGTACSM